MKKVRMDVSYLQWMTILSICLGICQAYKECDTQEVYGARYNSALNGLYDVTPDLRCHGRTVWKKRDDVSGPQKYIYYYRRSIMSRGWLLGRDPCSNDREFGSAYVWNTNRRPDRGLLGWMEYDESDKRWRINGGFEVRCTEGLSYPQITGIVVGVLLGLALIGGVLGFFCARKK